MKNSYLRFVWRWGEDWPRTMRRSRIKRTQQRSREREHETAREIKEKFVFFSSCDWFYMLPTWLVIGNSLKSHKRSRSKQVKSMVRFISGYRTHKKKGGYCGMTQGWKLKFALCIILNLLLSNSFLTVI